MISEVDHRLRDWARDVLVKADTFDVNTTGTQLASATITLGPPRDFGDEPTVVLYLMGMGQWLAATEGRRPPLQVSLRYLVTACAKQPEHAHSMLSALLFAAMENEAFDVDLEPVAAQAWSGAGLFPQPSFTLRVPLRLSRPDPVIPLVKQAAEISQAPLTTIRGTVMGPNDTPVPGAYVRIAGSTHQARADTRGRFIMRAIAASPSLKTFTVAGKGYEQSLQIDISDPANQPLVIRFDALEV